MKKPSVVSFLITLMLAAVVCIQGSETVKDTGGEAVITGLKYLIQPVEKESVLIPATTIFVSNDGSNYICPLGIIKQQSYQTGVPVSFQLPNPKSPDAVKTDVYLTIKFQSEKIEVCNDYTKFWKVDGSTQAPKEPTILIGGYPDKEDSWFKIEKAGEEAGVYKLTTSDGFVGATPTEPRVSGTQLVLTNDKAKTLLVKFKKVNDANTAANSTSPVEKLGLRMFPFY